ncbi:DUF2252 domain-containing protein [Microbacterium terricola]|uniref:DUF2252 domain-containing protein n=1 Tax=Microbacterium terricola TaxID=344163 RepID=A0ABM8E2K4_9MICO|nr:DUF2252 domain-containing protein [Microbacterium terricola]UYK40105.1 DUF2252 domain-containing protein [Microbacterium terricola]BDV32193.1 hypothetical protein Microterr_28530 [Microbacterium terricola]
MTPNAFETGWAGPQSRASRVEEGRQARSAVARSSLSQLGTGPRDPLGIIAAQNSTRLPDLIALRTERMSASPFAFYRGSAALMAADLARGPSSGISVASCGDAHLANFGFYASPQRTLVFDVNDFDEAAWAPWEWDVKRLVTSVVIAGEATARDEVAVREAALSAVRTYARVIAAAIERTPLERYYSNLTPADAMRTLDRRSRAALKAAMADAERRTTERAARRITAPAENGRLVFVENPPTMTHVEDELEDRLQELIDRYRDTANVDIKMILTHYAVSDAARRVVGVGSVGTRCFLVVLQDGDGSALLLQAKEAGRSVLVQYGGTEQPPAFHSVVEQSGEGARVVALQRILQSVSDPFLGHLRALRGDMYVRQFHDMKGGIDAETLEDAPFLRYANACASSLARAHSQSVHAANVAGYIGNGRVIGESILEWAYDYAAVSRADYDAFIAAQS